MTPRCRAPEGRTRKLGELKAGARAVVRRVSGEPELLRRLMELGFVPGTTISGKILVGRLNRFNKPRAQSRFVGCTH